MTIGDVEQELAEARLDTDAPISFVRTPDLNTRSISVVRYDLALREPDEVVDEGICAIRRNIEAILRYSLQRRIARLGRMPIELHVHATCPLDHGVAANRIGEWSHQHVCAVRLGRFDCGVHIGHQVARALGPKGIRNRGLEAEYRQGP